MDSPELLVYYISCKKKILVTAALPYANGPIHLGHLAGAYLTRFICTVQALKTG